MRRARHLAILTLLLTFSPGITASAQAPPRAVVAEAVVDAGDVLSGDDVVATFEIRNSGAAPLEISQVRPACGCTVVDFDRVIAPGATGTVKATVDTASLVGPNAKSITVFTNDVANPRLQLTIKSNVQSFIDAQPGYARFTSFVEKQGPETSTQIVWAPGREDFEIVSVESPQPWIRVSHRPAQEGDRIAEATGKQWRLDLTLAAEAPVGPVAEMVVVTTNHPKQKTLEIPVSGFVRPMVAVTPPDVDFGRIDRGSSQAWGILMRNFGAEPMAIRGVKSSVAGLEVEVQAVEEGKQFKVTFTPTPAMAKGPFDGSVELTTNLVGQPVIQIPISGEVI